MIIPESVREALFNLKSIEDVNVTRDAVLVHKWRETVCEWAVENLPEWTIEALSDSDDDEPVTEEWMRENGLLMEDDDESLGMSYSPGRCIENYFGVVRYAGAWQAVLSDSEGNNDIYLGDVKTRGQVRKLISALKGE